MDYWIPEERLRTLATYLQESGGISRENFISKTKELSQDIQLSQISKAQFLTSLIEVFHARQARDAAQLVLLYQRNGPPLFKNEFFELLHELDHSLEQRALERYYEEALSLGSSPQEGISCHAFTSVVLKYAIGQMGVGVYDLGLKGLILNEVLPNLLAVEGGESSYKAVVARNSIANQPDSLKEQEVVTTIIRKRVLRRG